MPSQFIAIGTSLGGFEAFENLLGELPKDFQIPIGVVQHRSHEDSEVLASLLANHILLPVGEVVDKQDIEEGHIYICPPNYHLLVDDGHFALSTDAPVLHARPSIDVFFESVATTFREGAIGVLLTGMSKDGTAGLGKIKAYGGLVIVQDPLAAEGRVMPESAIASLAIDKILPLEEIAALLTEISARAKG